MDQDRSSLTLILLADKPQCFCRRDSSGSTVNILYFPTQHSQIAYIEQLRKRLLREKVYVLVPVYFKRRLKSWPMGGNIALNGFEWNFNEKDARNRHVVNYVLYRLFRPRHML